VVAAAAVVDVVAQVLLAPVAPDVAIAVAPPGSAHGLLALAAAALGDGVRDLLAALAAAAAVPGVLADVGLAPVAPQVVVAVGPPGRAHGLLALAAAALGHGVRHLLAGLSASATVVGVLADVGLAAVGVDVAVAVGPAGLAGVDALGVVALDGGVGEGLALLAAVAAVVDVVLDARLAAGLVGVAVLEPGGTSPRISAPCNITLPHKITICKKMSNRKNTAAEIE
jgi:hypothetical protein